MAIILDGTAGITTPALSNSGNLTFTGTGNRITGDTNGATIANRLAFQDSVTNATTQFHVLPNGTAVNAGIKLEGSSTATNAASGQIDLFGATDFRINSTIRGTGTYLPMTFYTGGSERMRIDTSGNVGIGTSSPSYKLHLVNGANCVAAIQSGDSNTSYLGFGPASNPLLHNIQVYQPGNAMAFWANGSERMRIDSSGNVGIGNNNPSAFGSDVNVVSSKSYVAGGGATGYGFYPYYVSATNYCVIKGDSSGNMTFTTGTSSPAERMRIDSSGNLLVGTTDSSKTAGVGFKVLPAGYATTPVICCVGSASTSASETWNVYSTGAGAYRFYVGYQGTVYATNTTISAISDQRYKENIRDLDVGLDAVMALKPRVFDWKEGKGKDIKNDRGFIAQEFEQVFPDLIDEWKDPAPEGEEPYKSVRQDLIPVLVKAMQELKTIVDAQQAEIDQLKGAK